MMRGGWREVGGGREVNNLNTANKVEREREREREREKKIWKTVENN